jgi:hypothetical protein
MARYRAGVSAAALVLSATVVGAGDEVAPSFSIVVTSSPTGLQMSCSATVDTHGVRGPESPAGAPGQDGPVG